MRDLTRGGRGNLFLDLAWMDGTTPHACLSPHAAYTALFYGPTCTTTCHCALSQTTVGQLTHHLTFPPASLPTLGMETTVSSGTVCEALLFPCTGCPATLLCHDLPYLLLHAKYLLPVTAYIPALDGQATFIGIPLLPQPYYWEDLGGSHHLPSTCHTSPVPQTTYPIPTPLCNPGMQPGTTCLQFFTTSSPSVTAAYLDY